MAGEPRGVFRGPDADAEQVAAILVANGIAARVHSNSGAAHGWAPAGAADSVVIVASSDVANARRLLSRNPRWRPLDDASEERTARNSYLFFVIAFVVIGACGLGLVAYVLLS